MPPVSDFNNSIMQDLCYASLNCHLGNLYLSYLKKSSRLNTVEVFGYAPRSQVTPLLLCLHQGVSKINFFVKSIFPSWLCVGICVRMYHIFFRIFEQKLSQRQPLQDLITFNKYLVFSGQYSSQNSCLNHKILSAKSDCCTHRKQFFQHGTMVAWYHGTMVLQNSSDSTMVLQNSSDSTIMIF